MNRVTWAASISLSSRQLNRAPRAPQSLQRRERSVSVDAVRHGVALQTQKPAPPCAALANRGADSGPTVLGSAWLPFDLRRQLMAENRSD